MKENLIEEKSFAFAIHIVELHKWLQRDFDRSQCSRSPSSTNQKGLYRKNVNRFKRSKRNSILAEASF